MLSYLSARMLTFMHVHKESSSLNDAQELNHSEHSDHLPHEEGLGHSDTEHMHEASETIANNSSISDHAGHSHGSGDGSIWEAAWDLITEPAHAITEVFYSLLFDAILIPITILIYKRIREPKLRAEIHKEIDAEHGLEHSDCSGKINIKE